MNVIQLMLSNAYCVPVYDPDKILKKQQAIIHTQGKRRKALYWINEMKTGKQKHAGLVFTC